MQLTVFVGLLGLHFVAAAPASSSDSPSPSATTTETINASSSAAGTTVTSTSTATESTISPAPSGTPGTIPAGDPAPLPYTYPATGNQTEPEPQPYQPAGGINTNVTSATIPVYHPQSDFDFQSLQLVLYQEYIELDLFRFGLEKFSDDDFDNAGLGQADRDLITFMANQEIGHAQMVSNMLGPNAAKECNYTYPFENVADFVDFCQKLTRWGESGVYGFLEHLDSRPSAQLLLQSITTEARQQMIFREFQGLFPMPVWFETGITQSMAWTLLAPYITECPAGQKLAWQNFPGLNITNNPNGTDPKFGPSITHNRTQLTYPGREVHFQYEAPGKKVGPNGDYITNTTTSGVPKFAAWVSQLNTTYVPLYDLDTEKFTARATQPNGTLYRDINPTINDTMFVMLTDTDLFVTPHNFSLLNSHVVAGPALYQAG